MASAISDKMFLADYNFLSKKPSFLAKAVKWYKKDLTLPATVKKMTTCAVVTLFAYELLNFSPTFGLENSPIVIFVLHQNLED